MSNFKTIPTISSEKLAKLIQEELKSTYVHAIRLMVEQGFFELEEPIYISIYHAITSDPNDFKVRLFVQKLLKDENLTDCYIKDNDYLDT